MWTGLLLKENKPQTSWERQNREKIWGLPFAGYFLRPLNNDFSPLTNQISIIFCLWKWNNQHVTSVGEIKIWVSDRIRTYDLPKTGRALCPLSYGELMESEAILLGSYLTRVLHTARISNDEIVLYDERMRDGEFQAWLFAASFECHCFISLHFYLITFSKNNAKIIPVQNNFLNKYIF